MNNNKQKHHVAYNTNTQNHNNTSPRVCLDTPHTVYWLALPTLSITDQQ